MRRRPFPFATVAAYATCVAIWGTTWLAIKIALGGFPPVFGAGVRFSIAGVLLYAVGFLRHIDFRRDAPPIHLVVVLAFTMFGLSYALTYLAETHLSSGLVAVLYGTLPFFVFAFAHVFVHERATFATVIGAIVALAGVGLISVAGSVHADLAYVAAALAAAALSGFGNVYLKRYARAEPLATLPPAMLAAGIGMSLWGAVFERIDRHAAAQFAPILAVVYLAAAGSALAFYLNHWLLQRIDSGVMGLSALMIPLIAVVVGATFAHEIFNSRDLVGAALIVGGVWFAMRRTKPPQAHAVTESRAIA